MTTVSFPRSAAHTNLGSVALWTAQSLLALLFAFAGVAKLAMTAEALAKVGVPAGILRFVAVAELCGALGLVLPGVFRIRRGLTPLAAAGLVVIMVGATVLTAKTQGPAPALFPLVVGVLLVLVARGRREWLRELRSSPRTASRDPRGVNGPAVTR